MMVVEKMDEGSSDAVATVFNGFLALSMKEKVSLANILNDFFDHPDRREDMRKKNEDRVARLDFGPDANQCKCCRR